MSVLNMCHTATAFKTLIIFTKECASPTFYFEGLCYDECPQHSFPSASANDAEGLTTATATATATPTLMPSPTPTSNTSSSTAGLAPGTKELHEPGNSLSDKDDPLQAEDRRRRRAAANGVTSNPLLLAQRRLCTPCDQTCLRCYGARASECSTCYPGSQLRKLPQTNETYCYAYKVRSTGSEIDVSANASANEAQNYSQLTSVLLLMAGLVSLVSFTVVGGIVYHRRASVERSSEFYTRVALTAEGDSDEEDDEEIFTARIVDSKKDVLEYRDEVRSEQQLNNVERRDELPEPEHEY